MTDCYDESHVKYDVNMTLLNAQSLKNKEMVLTDYLLKHNSETSILTKT